MKNSIKKAKGAATGVSIRPARPEDRDILIALGVQQLQELDAFDNDILPTRANAEAMTDRYFLPAAAKGDPVLIAWCGDRPVGTIFWVVFSLPYRTRWKTAQTFGTYVIPEFRRQGIGRRLIAEAMKLLKAQGVQKVVVMAHRTNEASQRFLESWQGQDYGRVYLLPVN